MGVYIESMEMPKTCIECVYCWVGLKSCDAKYGLPVGDRWDIERASFCPLSDVPEPHGRLIDADVLLEAIKTDIMGGLNYERFIRETPTVIERSK